MKDVNYYNIISEILGPKIIESGIMDNKKKKKFD